MQVGFQMGPDLLFWVHTLVTALAISLCTDRVIWGPFFHAAGNKTPNTHCRRTDNRRLNLYPKFRKARIGRRTTAMP